MDLAACVQVAARCGAKIVATCADHPVYRPHSNHQIAILNVHCGLGVGKVAGAHVGDEGMHREFLLVGEPIDQVAFAEAAAQHGEIAASPQFVRVLAERCEVAADVEAAAAEGKAALVAARSTAYFHERKTVVRRDNSRSSLVSATSTASIHPSELVAAQCEEMGIPGLRMLRRLISLYVHPVVVNEEQGDYEERNSVTQERSVHQKQQERKRPGLLRKKSSLHFIGTAQQRHRAEAELRSVFTMFIMPIIDAKLSGNNETDAELLNTLNDLMNVVTTQLDHFGGHLRQFIVDDKGVVLIANFGLRGSTYHNMITDRALPAAKVIHDALQSNLGIENRIGCTLGSAYCGVVGGIYRNEFAVLGPSVNLAARLMGRPENPGILVDDSVRMRAGKEFSFNALPPIKAKGYDKLVPIFEPLSSKERRWGKPKRDFVGREGEMDMVIDIATDISMTDVQNKATNLFFMTSESGRGKSALMVQTIYIMRKLMRAARKKAIVTRNVSNEGDSLVPFSMFRSTFLDVLTELQADEGSCMGSSDMGRTRGGSVASQMSFASQGSLASASVGSMNMQSAMERLRFVANDMDAPPGFMDIVGYHLLGIETSSFGTEEEKGIGATSLEDIVKYMARAFVRCTSHADVVVLALDDVHLMDELSWRVVQSIFEQGRNILIFCAATSDQDVRLDEIFWERLRGTYRGQSRYHELELSPLDQDDIGKLIAKILGCTDLQIDPALSKEIHRQYHGLPAFASQIVKELKQGEKVTEMENGLIGLRNKGDAAMYSSLSDLIHHRLDALRPDVLKTLQIAAILGLEFELLDVVKLTKQLSKEEDAKHYENIRFALDEAVVEDILEESFGGGSDDVQVGDGNLSVAAPSKISHADEDNMFFLYVHNVWRNIILNRLLASYKRDIHRKIAISLESQLGQEEDYRSRVKLFRHWKASGDSCKASDLALEIGKSFENLGLQEQSILILEDALSMWASDASKDDNAEMIGGLSMDMVNGAEVSDIKNMIMVHIALAKVLANVHRGMHSAATYKNALAILGAAPAAGDLEDRSFVFPIFSGLFVAIKFGDVEQDDACSYEKELVDKFITQTELNGDPIHYGRALAMKGEVYGRLGEYDKAFEAHRRLEMIYDADLHSVLVCKAYGSDRVAQSFGHSARWHMQQGNSEEALRTCLYVVNTLMPKMEARNVHNACVMLWPGLWVMKDMGLASEARKHFDELVVQKFSEHYADGATTWALAAYTPTLMLLDLCRNQGDQSERIDEYTAWALDKKNLEINSSLNGGLANFSRDVDSINAEICLLLTRVTEETDLKKRLVENGIYVAQLSMERTRPKGSSKGMIAARQQISPVYEELKGMADDFRAAGRAVRGVFRVGSTTSSRRNSLVAAQHASGDPSD